MAGHVVLFGDDQTVQALVEQQVGAGGYILPGGELAGLELGAEPGIVVVRLRVAVDVVALLAGAGLAVGAEQLFQQFEVVGLGAEVTQVAPGGSGVGHLHLHRGAVVAVEAVTLDDGGLDAVAVEDVLEGALDGGGAGAGGPGDGDDRMLLGHGVLPCSLGSGLGTAPARPARPARGGGVHVQCAGFLVLGRGQRGRA